MQEKNSKKQSPKDFDVCMWLKLNSQQNDIDRLNAHINKLDKQQNYQMVWILCLATITLVLVINLLFVLPTWE